MPSMQQPALTNRRFQKASLWGWLLGSITTVTLESASLSDGSMAVRRAHGEDEHAWQQRRAELLASTQKKVLLLVHAILQVRSSCKLMKYLCSFQQHRQNFECHIRSSDCTMQVLLATGLLQLRPFNPRLTATFGVLASALNCYMLAPSWPLAKCQPYVKTA